MTLSEEEEIKMELLAFLSQDKVSKFLLKFKDLQSQYNAMKKVYDKKIAAKIKEIVSGRHVSLENDMLRISVSQSVEQEKLIPISQARKLPQEIKDKILITKMSSPRLTIKIVEDEYDLDEEL